MKKWLIGALGALSVCGGANAGEPDFLSSNAFDIGSAAALYFHLPLGPNALPLGPDTPLSKSSSFGLRLGYNSNNLFDDIRAEQHSLLMGPVLDAKFSFDGFQMLSLQGRPLYGVGPMGETVSIFTRPDGSFDVKLATLVALGVIGSGLLASCLADEWPCEDNRDRDGSGGGGGGGGGGDGGDDCGRGKAGGAKGLCDRINPRNRTKRPEA